MSNAVLIIGESGSGKSTSIRNLIPTETFIINVLDKPLPFQGFKNKYVRATNGAMQGNYCATDEHKFIIPLINIIDEKRPEIKNLIIDDFQYIMSNEYMRRSKETGFTKYVDIGYNGWDIIRRTTECRPDLNCFILSHSDINANGKSVCKTIGKLLTEKITLEGMFTIIFHSITMDGEYKFLTQNDGHHLAKSPMGLFKDNYIDNDLSEIIPLINEYYSNINENFL